MKSWYHLGAALAVVLSVAACASEPEPTTPSISCELLSSTQVSYLSPTRVTNPFMPIGSLIRGTEDEFVVVRLRLALPQPDLVVIDGSVRDEAGSEVASLKTYAQMVRYWTGTGEDITYRDASARKDVLTRWYPPELQFTARKGRSEYVVAFIGKNPLPRPCTATLTVSLGDAAPQDFSFPVPPKKKDGLF